MDTDDRLADTRTSYDAVAEDRTGQVRGFARPDPGGGHGLSQCSRRPHAASYRTELKGNTP
ncbi:hypothetical protein ABZZ36_29435 [Actinacidiphila glaucinigra]|uniref:hypothetical protein n=1 Tax=Actinacidiphila glaucinigra TaxID=235986 RepID=UPI0033BA05D7